MSGCEMQLSQHHHAVPSRQLLLKFAPQVIEVALQFNKCEAICTNIAMQFITVISYNAVNI
jgi:hypothetical protein